ncbi:RloB family protein [Alistipes finegoldii]|jgi:putative abortive phage resistance protein|uniref:RloB family protein n=1 Tax=Alistipes finegoldii TaxID=214856 RepID=UPI003AF0A54A
MARRANLKSRPQEDEDLKRPERVRKYKMFILIVCEDEKTEPQYFESFKNKINGESIYLRPVGTGLAPLGVVQRTIEEREKLKEESLKEIDQVWSVFDIDDANQNETTKGNFQSALELADSQNIQLAYSNEAFELWLLLHLTEVPHDEPMPRETIYRRLQEIINENPEYSNYRYDHYKFDSSFLDIIYNLGNEELASNRAIILDDHHGDKHPLECNPRTKVYLLVKELREWIEFYNYTPE